MFVFPHGQNSRNGTRSKTVLTEVGPVEIDVPRDRDGRFDPKLVRKACGRADRVVVIAYGGAKADAWWSQAHADLARNPNLRVLLLEPAQTSALARFAHRQMRLGVTIQDGAVLIASDTDSLSIEPRVLQPGSDA